MIDSFGVPEALFGTHPDWFFPGLGRVVAVCAVLETRALELAESLAYVQQGSYTKNPIVTLKKNALRDAQDLDAINAGLGVGTPIAKTVDDYFGSVVDVMQRRNGVVHANWPAQPGATQFGWLPALANLGSATRVTADNTRVKLVDLITTASGLVMWVPRVMGVVSPAVSSAVAAGQWPRRLWPADPSGGGAISD